MMFVQTKTTNYNFVVQKRGDNHNLKYVFIYIYI